VFHRIEDSIFYGKRFEIVNRRKIDTYPILKLEKDDENTSYSAMLNIGELVPPPESVPIPFDPAWTEFRNSGNWLDSESVEVAGIEPNSRIERNSWESVRFHRDGIPGMGWN
jgi:hypothetical protein